MANKKTSNKVKSRIIQKGGFLSALLGPIIGVIGSVIAGAISRKKKKMKYAQKMALVPAEQVVQQVKVTNPTQLEINDKISNIQENVEKLNIPQNPLVGAVQKLDGQMRSILDDKSLTTNQKVNRYNQALDEYMLYLDKLHDDHDSPPLIGHVDPEKSHSTEINPFFTTTSTILKNTLPDSMKDKGGRLLELVEAEHKKAWTEKGEFIHEGDVIEGSNIVDLIHHILCNWKKKEPPGFDRFINIIRKSSISPTLSKRSLRKQTGHGLLHKSKIIKSRKYSCGIPKLHELARWDRY